MKSTSLEGGPRGIALSSKNQTTHADANLNEGARAEKAGIGGSIPPCARNRRRWVHPILQTSNGTHDRPSSAVRFRGDLGACTPQLTECIGLVSPVENDRADRFPEADFT